MLFGAATAINGGQRVVAQEAIGDRGRNIGETSLHHSRLRPIGLVELLADLRIGDREVQCLLKRHVDSAKPEKRPIADPGALQECAPCPGLTRCTSGTRQSFSDISGKMTLLEAEDRDRARLVGGFVALDQHPLHHGRAMLAAPRGTGRDHHVADRAVGDPHLAEHAAFVSQIGEARLNTRVRTCIRLIEPVQQIFRPAIRSGSKAETCSAPPSA